MEDYSDIKETLEKLEVNLVDYAEAIKKNSDDGTLVHLIFRFAHNLKSALAMAHKECSSHLIHSAENNFDLIRKGKAKPTHELIRNCLFALDLIRTNLEGEEESLLDLEVQTKTLDRISQAAENIESILDHLTLKLSEKELEVYEKAKGSNLKFYRIEKLMSSGIDKDIFLDLPIYSDITNNGLLVTSYPEFNDIPKEVNEFVLTIIFASNLSFKDLEFVIFDPFKEIEISRIEKKEIVSNHETKKAEDRKSLKVLIVDDDPTTLKLLQSIISRWGKCEPAENGMKAIELFKERIEGKDNFDLVCLDIRMPKIDGFETLKTMRELESKFDIPLRSRSKILMISATKNTGNKMSSFRKQCDGYLTKPIKYEKILEELKKLRLIDI